MAWSEANLHRWLLARRTGAARITGSLGHDAAVLARPGGRVVTCIDATFEGVHFTPSARAREVGAKAALRALSDLAATAAEPVALLLAVVAPRRTSEVWLRAAIAGADRAAARFGAALVGGDLACVEGPRGLTCTAIGVLRGARRPPGRDRARPGELVLLTGPVGGSLLGRHLAIEPRFAEARFLFAAGASAMMDVSDGLALDLSRLAARSRVRIDLERIPVHADARRAARRDRRSAEAHALSDGEDHELLVTIGARAWRRSERTARRRFPRLAVVGRVRAGKGLFLRRDPDGGLEAWDGRGGYVHGG
jgi:thiamine-monophosphate kinase